MPVVNIKTTKRGPRELLEVDYKGTSLPALPPVCPCCLDPVEPGAFLEVNSPPHMLRFPACRICARHVPFFDKLSSMIGYLALALGLITTAAGLIIIFGIVQGLAWPFRSAITGLSTLIVIGVLTAVFCIASGLLTLPLQLLMAKRKCEETPVVAARLKGETMSHAFRFTFENIRYGHLFAEANGAAAAPANNVQRTGKG